MGGMNHEVISYAALAAVLASPVVALFLQHSTRWIFLGGAGTDVAADRPLTIALGLLALGAAAIHFAVMPQHFEEFWASGVFFLVVASFQLVTGLAFVRGPSRAVALVGSIVNAGVVLVWLWSRLVAVPSGPHAGSVEPFGTADVIASAFEILIAAGLAVSVLSPGRAWLAQRRVAGASASLAILVLVGAIVPLTTAALAAPAHGHELGHRAGPAEAHPDDTAVGHTEEERAGPGGATEEAHSHETAGRREEE